ncbi:hypothetical protein IVW58_10655 [Salmonella enterica subsp. enterica serovar Worthington]|nr:hypothetical protein [Salmonella enterica subsp. enterica serovar Worthington]
MTYRLSRDLWQAGQHARADAQMRSLAQQKPNDPEQVYAYGLYLSGSDRDRAALAHLNTLPTSQWNSNIQELAGRLQSNQCWKALTACAIAAKNAKRKRCYVSSLPLRALS